MKSYVDSMFQETLNNFVLTDDLFNGITVVGIGALIYNGLSYKLPEANTTILCNNKEDHNWHSGIFRYIYLPNYDKSIGFEDNSSIPSPERAICDYLLYPDILRVSEAYEAIQFYEDDEDYGDLEEIVRMATRLGIPEKDIRQLIADAEEVRY